MSQTRLPGFGSLALVFTGYVSESHFVFIIYKVGFMCKNSTYITGLLQEISRLIAVSPFELVHFITGD